VTIKTLHGACAFVVQRFQYPSSGETTYLEVTEQRCEGSMSARLAEFSAYVGTQKLLIIPRSQPGGTISINHFPKSGSRLIWASTRCIASLVKVTPVS